MGTTKCCVGSRGAIAALVVLLAATALPASAGATLVSAQNGNLAAFTGGMSTIGGALSAAPSRHAGDRRAFAASYAGVGDPAVSGALETSWTPGQSVAWGAAFRLAPNFHAATSGLQELMGWSAGAVQEGVMVDYSDNSAYLVAAPGSITQQTLVGPFTLPVGRWFTLRPVRATPHACEAPGGARGDRRPLGEPYAAATWLGSCDSIQRSSSGLDSNVEISA
jgi:hypothetical protein